ncbi:MAG TPA: acyl-CoA thioesterase, partial [Burkholderiaceae bacterium]|nr:acyl-CoA thioesterase [Burkholderiaceae bacterium]
QVVLASAEVLEYENRLKIGYRITDRASGERLTKGWSVQVAIDAKTRELQFVSPTILLDKMRGR